jgi:hypothetical protein
MRNMTLSIASLAAVLVASGCATHNTAKLSAAESLADTSKYDADYSSEERGEDSYARGDKYTAANLLFQADQADHSIKNRYNLATAYAAIGKSGAAHDMYASLVIDGQYTRLSQDSPQGAPDQTYSFNVGRESEKRLQALDALPPGPAGSIGAVGTGYSDEEARVLDQNAEDERALPVTATRVAAQDK